MAENRIRENTIKPKPLPETVEETPTITESAPEPKKKATEKKVKRVEKTKKEKAPKEKKEKQPREKDPRIGYVAGFLLLCIALFLSLGILSFFVSYFSGSYHETDIVFLNKAIQFDNITGKFGAWLALILVKESFGLGAVYFPYLLTVIGLHFTLGTRIRPWQLWKHAIMLLAWIPLFFAFIHFVAPNRACEIFGGAVGKFLNAGIYDFLGNSGVILILVFVFLLYLLYEYNLNIDAIRQWRERRAERKAQKQELLQNNIEDPTDNDHPDEDFNPDDYDDILDDELPPITVIHRPAENTIRRARPRRRPRRLPPRGGQKNNRPSGKDRPFAAGAVDAGYPRTGIAPATELLGNKPGRTGECQSARLGDSSRRARPSRGHRLWQPVRQG